MINRFQMRTINFALATFIMVFSVNKSKADVIATAAEVIKSGYDNLSYTKEGIEFFRSAIDNATKGKNIPSKYPETQRIISRFQDFRVKLEGIKLYQPPRYEGDYSTAAQQDCSRYKSVLSIYQSHYTAYKKYSEDALPRIPQLITTINNLSDDLSSRLESANALTKLYAGLATNPIEEIRQFYAWSFLDMTNISRSIAETKGAVDDKKKQASQITDRINRGLADAGRVLNEYIARIPAQQRYCERKGL